MNRKLTLISAPAGYGKSTLLSEWINQQEIPSGWLSLDLQDNQPARFLAYLYACLEPIQNFVKDEISFNSEPIKSQQIEELLILLINQLSTVDQHFTMVLDDYYLIHEEKIHNIVTYLLDNLPSKIRLVIATRTDPPLRLAQLRVQGELLEIRAQDLRFTDQEAMNFLNQRMGLGLTSADIETLLQKTEGWIAGLQLAAISLNGLQDKTAFVRAFAGDDRYIADYLLDEALTRQPAHTQDFLLKTSILDRLCAPLCNAITGRNDSQKILTELEQANLFLISLDNQRNWYRYHHLFADLLKNRLYQTSAKIITNLHNSASIWYQENGLFADAVNQALLANDLEQIIDLTEEMAVYKMDYRESIDLLTWLDRLPTSAFQENPRLLVTRTWALFNTGEYDAAEANLVKIERMLKNQSISPQVVGRIQGHVAAIQSNLAELRGDDNGVIQQAKQALEYLPANEIKLRSFMSIRMANCLAWFGELDKAIIMYRETGEASKLAGDGHLAIIALSEMAVIQMCSGRLQQALKNIEKVNIYAEMLSQRDGRRLPAMGILYRHISYIHREQNKLSKAEHYANQAIKICQQWGEKEALSFAILALTKVQFSKGEYLKVEQSCDRFLKVASQISPKAFDQFLWWKYYFQLLQGKTENIQRWIKSVGLSTQDEFGYERRYEYQNLALFLATMGNYPEALVVNQKLLRVVSAVGDVIFQIQHLVFQSIVLDELNRSSEARIAIEEALSYAAEEGYQRSILDLGPAITPLLYKAAQDGIQPKFCLQLIDALDISQPSIEIVRDRTDELLEPLSEREIEVLKHISQGSTNQEIAQALVLSLYTVKSHARNIYSKLGVKNRTEAVARARSLGLLSQD
jgi:LuxR family maltose regulon positive regulatory protein